MAISTAAAILGGAAISAGSSLIGAGAAGDAADAQAGAARESADIQRDSLQFNKDVYQTGREDLSPYRQAGTTALASLADLFLPGGGQQIRVNPQINALQQQRKALVNQMSQVQAPRAPQPAVFTGDKDNELGKPSFAYRQWLAAANQPAQTAPVDTSGITNQVAQIDAQINQLQQSGESQTSGPDYTEFFKSPGYNFRLDEGIKARDRSAAARGRLQSGAQELELLRYGQGFASGEFNNYANRLSQIAGAGQNAAGSSTTFGLQAAATGGQISANIGNAVQNAGQANASGFVGQANALNQGFGNLAFLGQQGFGGGGTSAGFDPSSGINWATPRIGA